MRSRRLVATCAAVGVSAAIFVGVLGQAYAAGGTPPSPPGVPVVVGTPPAPPAAGTPRPTGVPLSAHLMAVTSVTSSQKAGTLNVRWVTTLASQVKGFNVYAGTQRLNTRTIATHKSTGYVFKTKWAGQGSIYLGVIYRDGTEMKVASR